MNTLKLAFLSVLVGMSAVRAQDLPSLASASLSGSAEATKSLREAGPRGLEALLTAAGPKVAELRQNKARLDSPDFLQLRTALDATARQRDAFASGLYWFTNLEVAKTEAAKTGKPILSLRLLGNLDEEYCCANSRFFRTVLYANNEVSKVLREHYVLHWKSVRPAPLLTIDMGDGRRIKRTITGNSIHYILNAEGKVLDALPGIYSPSAFLAALERAKDGSAGKPAEAVRAWHGREAHTLCMEWLAAAIKAGAYGQKAQDALALPEEGAAILQKISRTAFPHTVGSPDFTVVSTRPNRFDSPITARTTNAIDGLLANGASGSRKVETTIKPFPYPTDFDPPKAMVERPIMKHALPGLANAALDPASSGNLPADFDPPQTAKSMVERPIMNRALPGPANAALDPASPEQPEETLAGRMTPALWKKIAEPFELNVRLDEGSRRFMIQKLPVEIASAEEAAAGIPATTSTPFGRQLQRFQDAIARDMVRNEYYYHTQIHQWLEEDKDGQLSNDVEALNRRVYQDLFLTPDYDAWLGLVPEDTYTALEKDGCACDKGAPPMRQIK